MFVLFLILVTPEIMDAIALLGWFVRVGGPFNHPVGPINNGILRLWVGQSLYTSAVVTLIVRARLAGLDESLEEAAADLGAPPARAFRQITLPLISSALIAGGLLSFTLCLDNTIIANSVSTAGSSTFPVYVIGTAKSTTKPFWGAGAVVLFGDHDGGAGVRRLGAEEVGRLLVADRVDARRRLSRRVACESLSSGPAWPVSLLRDTARQRPSTSTLIEAGAAARRPGSHRAGAVRRRPVRRERRRVGRHSPSPHARAARSPRHGAAG